MKSRFLPVLLTLVAIIAFHGCGFGGGTEPDPPDPTGPSLYFPLKTGTSWTYRCIEPDSAGADSTYTLEKTITGTTYFPPDSVSTYNPPYNDAIPWFRQADRDSTFFLNDGDYIWMGEISQGLVDFNINGFVPFRAVPIYYEDEDSFATLIGKGSGLLHAEIIFSVVVVDSLEDVIIENDTFFNCLRLETFLQDSSLLGINTTQSSMWFADSIGEIKRHDHTVTGTANVYYEELIDYTIGG